MGISDDHALRPRVVSRRTLFLHTRLPHLPALQTLFPPEHHIAPGRAISALTVGTDALVQDFHPAFLIFARVGVKVYHFTVAEADAEAFLDEHVALFLFCEAGFATTATLTSRLFLGQGSTIINEL